jgi:hypothetical protein
VRSLDEGRTRLPPVLAGSKPLPPPIVDPETGILLPQPGFPSAAVAPDGTVYVAVEHNTSASSGGIGVARSRDGGRSWTSTTLPGVTAFAFEPAIAVDGHGTVGVTWYDLRNDRPGDAALTADVWFAHSQDRGGSWRQTHVAGPTDLRTAPLPGHNCVGEYQGLAGLPAVFTLAARPGQGRPDRHLLRPDRARLTGTPRRRPCGAQPGSGPSTGMGSDTAVRPTIWGTPTTVDRKEAAQRRSSDSVREPRSRLHPSWMHPMGLAPGSGATSVPAGQRQFCGPGWT